MAKFKPGESGNKEGRPPGPNKITTEIRKTFKAIIADELEKLPEILEKLEPKDRLLVFIKLLPYCLPRLEMISIDSGELINNHPETKLTIQEAEAEMRRRGIPIPDFANEGVE